MSVVNYERPKKVTDNRTPRRINEIIWIEIQYVVCW